MEKYKLLFTKSVAKDLKPLPQKDIKKILQRIEILADDPRGAGCKKLSAKEFYRVRQGIYRILYEIQDNRLIVKVVKVTARIGTGNQGSRRRCSRSRVRSVSSRH